VGNVIAFFDINGYKNKEKKEKKHFFMGKARDQNLVINPIIRKQLKNKMKET